VTHGATGAGVLSANLHLCSPTCSRLWHDEDMAMGLLYLR
jgi:hypothetical protein